jgi:hypothetical protein
MNVKQPKIRVTEKLGEQVARLMSSASVSRADAPSFENDDPPAWVSKLAKDAASTSRRRE